MTYIKINTTTLSWLFCQGISVIRSYKLSCNNSYYSDIGSRGYGMDWSRNTYDLDNAYFRSNKYYCMTTFLCGIRSVHA